MPEAERQRVFELAWWLEHRDKNPGLFTDEFTDLIALLKANPHAGNLYLPRSNVRRCLLKGSRYHVYYRYDAAEDEVIIYAVWSAQRRRGPNARMLR